MKNHNVSSLLNHSDIIKKVRSIIKDTHYADCSFDFESMKYIYQKGTISLDSIAKFK